MGEAGRHASFESGRWDKLEGLRESVPIDALRRSERSSLWPRTPGDSVQLQALLLQDAQPSNTEPPFSTYACTK